MENINNNMYTEIKDKLREFGVSETSIAVDYMKHNGVLKKEFSNMKDINKCKETLLDWGLTEDMIDINLLNKYLKIWKDPDYVCSLYTETLIML